MVHEKEQSVLSMITDFIGRIPDREATAKFNELSDEYYKEVEHCHATHFEQQENLNFTNKITGERRTVEIEPKLSAIENLYREKARDLAASYGYNSEEQDEQHTQQANDNTQEAIPAKQLTDDELREQEKQEYIQRKELEDLERELRSRSKRGMGRR